MPIITGRPPSACLTAPRFICTLGARAVHEEATAALRPLLSGVHMAEDLSELLEGLRDIQ